MDLSQQLIALSQIIFIDLVLAGDNAIVVGLAASRVAPHLRARVVFWGVAGAVVLRVMFAVVATQLLAIIGLTLAGGVLLLYVCWKMYREIASATPVHAMVPAGATAGGGGGGNLSGAVVPAVGFGAALTQIIIADVSMSLDNVLAVAGAAKGELWILVTGLVIAIVFMGVASTYIAKLLTRYHWITWIGLLIVLYVAMEMIWKGTHQVGCAFVSEATCRAGVLPTLVELLT